MTDTYMQIGAFSRSVGVSADVLRAWERRYGLPRPRRTENGRRLYGRADAQLVAAMRRALERGVPAAEAARLATAEPAEPAAPEAVDGGELGALRAELDGALARFDDASAHEQLDRLFGVYSVDAALAEVVLPHLRELGERWACGEIGVGHEHFASNLIHGRLLSLARKWDAGHGPRALLAAPAGELHTIGLLAFGLALWTRGWRITYLGADTPVSALAQVAETLEPAQIVLAGTRADVYVAAEDGLAELAGRVPLALGGAGAEPSLGRRLGAAVLDGDPVSEAARVAAGGTG
jgi:MerR family transcriptional regulator, light-induced transcriptional regulator